MKMSQIIAIEAIYINISLSNYKLRMNLYCSFKRNYYINKQLKTKIKISRLQIKEQKPTKKILKNMNTFQRIIMAQVSILNQGIV